MEAFVTHPEEGGPFPAVIVYQDVFGPREELYDVARRIATVGYYAMVPDFYYRNGRLRVTSRRTSARGRSPTSTRTQEQRARAAGKALSNAMAVDDTGGDPEIHGERAGEAGPEGRDRLLHGRAACAVRGRRIFPTISAPPPVFIRRRW